MPATYFMPEDYKKLENVLIDNENDKTYIAKPSKGFGGHGIVLI